MRHPDVAVNPDDGTDRVQPSQWNKDHIIPELSADLDDPAEGTSVLWISDGTGTGIAGDLLMKTTSGGVTETRILPLTDSNGVFECSIELPVTTATCGQIKQNGTRVFHTYGTSNTFFGKNSGNFTLSGTNNFCVGNNTGAALTTGNGNLLFGLSAGITIDTGGYNTVIGTNAANNCTSGSRTIYLGQQAGRFLANGSTANISSDYCIYIGDDTRSQTNNDQNQIVIGYQAIGNGSNTTTIGNTSVTDSYIEGKLHISSEAGTYIDHDGSANMTFTDAVTGTKTLAQLASGGVSGALQDRIGFSVASFNPIVAGVKAYHTVPFDATIEGWYIESDTSGDITVDVKVGMVSPVSLVGVGTKPFLSSSSSNSDATPDWDTLSVSEGDVLVFELTGDATINKVILTLDILSI